MAKPECGTAAGLLSHQICDPGVRADDPTEATANTRYRSAMTLAGAWRFGADPKEQTPPPGPPDRYAQSRWLISAAATAAAWSGTAGIAYDMRRMCSVALRNKKEIPMLIREQKPKREQKRAAYTCASGWDRNR